MSAFGAACPFRLVLREPLSQRRPRNRPLRRSQFLDKLLIEGSVDAKLTNCRAIEIAESGLFKGSTTIDEAEIRGRFEGDLIVRNRLLIKATGRVSGTISYGQIEIECGGQIFGDIHAQLAGQLGRAPLPGGFAAFIPDDRSGIH